MPINQLITKNSESTRNSNNKMTVCCKDECEISEIPSITEATPITEKEKRKELCNLILRLLLLFVIGNFLFSSFFGLSNATTSLLPENNLGFVGLSVSNSIIMIISLIVIGVINKLWGIKKIFTFCAFISVLYPLSFFYPVSYIFILGSMVRGIGFSLTMNSMFIYGSKLIYRYHSAVGGNLDVLLVAMSGLNYGTLGGGYFFGNILEYAVLNTNQVFNSTELETSICGANYCNEDLSNLTTVQSPPNDKYYTLVGIYSGIMLLGSVLCLFLVDFSCEPRRHNIFQEFLLIIKNNFKILIDPRGYLLIIITIFTGAKEAFLVAVFTYAFVNCTLGIAHIGEVMMAYGLGQILMSVCNWLSVKLIKRVPTLGIGCLILIGCFVTMLVFPLTSTNNLSSVYIGIVAVYAIAASMIATTTFSMYPLLFQDDGSSFGVAIFWSSFGAMVCTATNHLFCISVKLYLLIAVAIVSFLLFSYLEYLIHKGKFSSSETNKT